MTTVVFRDGVLASDSAAEIAGWVLPQPHQKVHRLPDGRLAAITGGAASAGLAIDALKAGNDPDWSALSDESRVVIVSADGKSVRVHEGKAHYDDVTTPYFAYGSGMPVALGALFAGADAVTAVRAAIAIDTNSGGDVQVERIAHRPSKTLKQEAHYTYGPCVADKAAYPTHSGFVPILSPVVAPEAYTRWNAEDIHD